MKFRLTLRVVSVMAAVILCLPQLSRADQKAMADARKAVSDAQTAVNKCQVIYDKASKSVKTQFTKSPEYVAASKDLAAAKIALEKATKPVLEKVYGSKDYITAKKTFDDSDAQVKSLQVEVRNGASKAPDLAAANKVRTAATQKMQELENDAVASDPAIQTAQKASTDAQTKIDELTKTKLQPMLDADKPCIEAKKNLDEAMDKLKTAKAALDQAKEDAKNQPTNPKGGGMGH